jgi:hypothetical protein
MVLMIERWAWPKIAWWQNMTNRFTKVKGLLSIISLYSPSCPVVRSILIRFLKTIKLQIFSATFWDLWNGLKGAISLISLLSTWYSHTSYEIRIQPSYHMLVEWNPHCSCLQLKNINDKSRVTKIVFPERFNNIFLLWGIPLPVIVWNLHSLSCFKRPKHSAKQCFVARPEKC